MPPDNAATVAPGTDVSFPQDGPTSGTTITRTGPSSFNLSAIGTYQVLFQVSVTEAGQLILTLNGADLAYTVVGRATGTSQIVGMALVQTTVINSVLTVRNPAGEFNGTNHHSSRWRNKACFSTPCYHATRIEGNRWHTRVNIRAAPPAVRFVTSSMRNDCERHCYSRLVAFRVRKYLQGYQFSLYASFNLAAGQTDFVSVCPEQ